MRYELSTKARTLKFTTWDNMMELSRQLIKRNIAHTVKDNRFKIETKLGGNDIEDKNKSSR